MIRNQWYAVLASNQVPKKGIVGVIRMGEKLAFWRKKSGEVACIVDKCCHRGASNKRGQDSGRTCAVSFSRIPI